MGLMRGTTGATNVGAEVRGYIQSLLPGSGWTQVDSFTASVNSVISTVMHDITVWKNPAANNGAGQDFFVALATPVTPATVAEQTYVLCSLFEAYDSAARTISKYTIFANGNATTVQSDGTGSLGSVAVFATPAVGTNVTRPLSTAVPIAPNSSYAVLVTKDAIYVYASGTTSQGNSTGNARTFIVGRMVPRNTHAQENGLVQLPIPSATSSQNAGGFTRSPGRTSGETGVSQNFWQPTTSVPVTTDGYVSASDVLQGSVPRSQKGVVVENARATLRVELGAGALVVPLGDQLTTDDLNITVNGAAKTYVFIGNNLWVDQAAV